MSGLNRQKKRNSIQETQKNVDVKSRDTAGSFIEFASVQEEENGWKEGDGL